MQANQFAILENKKDLSHAYLCYGDFTECADSFTDVLSKLNIRLRSPGHYIFENETFGVNDARDLIEWYHSGQTSNDDSRTVAVITSSVIKKDAQQMLLKILEEAKPPYTFFIFVKPGTEIIETVLSRVQIINLHWNEDREISKFVNLSPGEKIKKVAADIKGMESSEVRNYTESLARSLIFFYSKDLNKENITKTKELLKIQKFLADSYIAPKFILDYIVTVV